MRCEWDPRTRRRHVRASDGERELVAGFLRDQAVEGRLTPDELEERLHFAYRSLTLGDLDRLTADLPPGPLEPFAPRPRARRGNVRLLVGAGVALVALSVPWLLGLVLVVAFASAVAFAAVVAAVAASLAPFVALLALAVIALRRRRPRRWDLPAGLR